MNRRTFLRLLPLPFVVPIPELLKQAAPTSVLDHTDELAEFYAFSKQSMEEGRAVSAAGYKQGLIKILGRYPGQIESHQAFKHFVEREYPLSLFRSPRPRLPPQPTIAQVMSQQLREFYQYSAQSTLDGRCMSPAGYAQSIKRITGKPVQLDNHQALHLFYVQQYAWCIPQKNT